jgi:YD repeat-containing protein
VAQSHHLQEKAPARTVGDEGGWERDTVSAEIFHQPPGREVESSNPLAGVGDEQRVAAQLDRGDVAETVDAFQNPLAYAWDGHRLMQRQCAAGGA